MTISENQPISVSNLSSAISTRQSSLAINVQVRTEESPGPERAYRVNISQEGRDLQAKEGDPSKKDEAKQKEKSSSGEAAGEASGSESPQSNIDEQIIELQEKIKEIKEKIAALANDNSEAAQQQRKVLETQLLELTTQLLSLMNKKTKSA